MSIAELTSSTLPRLSGRLTLRRLQSMRAQALKATRRRNKKFVRSIVNWQRSQYYLPAAVRDLKAAAARNEDIVLATTFVSLTLVFAFASMFAHIMLQSFLTMSYLNDVTGFSVLPLFVLFGGVLATLSAWLAAFMSNALSLAVMDGANRKRIKSLRSTFRRALKLATRTATSWLLLGAVLVAPMMVLGIVSLLFIRMFLSGTTAFFEAVTIDAALAILWTLYALSTYSLAPQVALFEEKLPLLDILKRSKQLVLRRGRPFILALYLCIAAFLGVAYGLTTLAGDVMGTASDIIFYAGVLVAVIATNLILTALYRKRRLARVS